MAIRVAILTDIHGNAPALQAVLADLAEQPGVGHIYVLGDMISIGPDTNAVLALLTARDDVTMLRGNHEEYVLAVRQGRDPHLRSDDERAHIAWVAASLDDRYLPLLAELPQVLAPVHAGKTLLLLHYHLEGDGRFAAVDYQPSLAKLEARYGTTAAAAICFGHHHPRHLFASAQRVYVNPGALGCHDRPLARYAILDPAATPVGVEMREVPYDNRAFLASYEERGVAARQFVLAAFHGNQHQPGRRVLPADGPADRAWLAGLWQREWGGDTMVTRGQTHRLADLPALVAWEDGVRTGAAVYRLAGGQCELISLNAAPEGTGTGSALLAATEAAAKGAGCRRLWLITSNDNLEALRFYQRRGYRLAAVYPGAVDAARRLKPSIPAVGLHGIPLHDDLELARDLAEA